MWQSIGHLAATMTTCGGEGIDPDQTSSRCEPGLLLSHVTLDEAGHEDDPLGRVAHRKGHGVEEMGTRIGA